jgi:hypothetical protein
MKTKLADRYNIWKTRGYLKEDDLNFNCFGCPGFDGVGCDYGAEYEFIEDQLAIREYCPRVTDNPILEEF